MSASEENNMAETTEDDTMSFEEAMEAIDQGKFDVEGEEEEAPMLWATIQYEEGTSGPLKFAEGVMVDDEYGVTVIDPDSGIATSIGENFIVRVDVQSIVVGDEEAEADDDQDQA